LLILALATACVGGVNEGNGENHNNPGAGDALDGIVSGEGVNDSAPQYGFICAGEVRIESFEKIPAKRTWPEKHIMTFTIPAQLDPKTKTIPTYTLERGDYFTTPSGCVLRFDGVGTAMVEGYLQPGVNFTEWPAQPMVN